MAPSQVRVAAWVALSLVGCPASDERTDQRGDARLPPPGSAERCGATQLEGRVRRALRAAELESAHSPQVAEILVDLAVICRQHGQLGHAVDLTERAILIWELHPGADKRDAAKLGESMVLLAELQQQAGDPGQAERAYQRALRLTQQRDGPDHPNIAVCAMGLGGLYYRQARWREAEGMYRRAVAIREGATPDTHNADLGMALRNLALSLERQGRIVEAADALGHAVAIFERHLAPDDPTLLELRRQRDNLRARPAP